MDKNTIVYHIDKYNLTIISGPHTPTATQIKKLTSCGNPDLLPIEKLLALGIVPEVRATLTANQKYGTPTVSIDMVEIPAIPKTQTELDAEAQAAADAQELQDEIVASPLTGVTFAQAVAWIDTNVTDLASAKAALKKIVKEIIIMKKQIGVN